MIKDFDPQGIDGFLSGEEWLLCQEDHTPELNRRYETVFTLTNGYMGTRGSLEEGSENEYPGNYLAGIFDKSEALARELVNIQNWLGIKVYSGNNLLSADVCEVIEFKRVLDMQKGILVKKMKLRDARGGETLIEGLRFLSRSDVHRAAIKLYITPLNYSGKMSVESTIDGSVTNSKDDPKQKVKHLRLIENSSLNNRGCYLETSTRDDNCRIGLGAMLRVCSENMENSIINFRKFSVCGEASVERCEFEVNEKQTIELEKYVLTHTSKDDPGIDLKSLVEKELEEFVNEGIDKELDLHIKKYEQLWYAADIKIDGDCKANKALRFNIFHLMSTANIFDPGVGIAAKALHGEGYKGHVFWDMEIFMLPFFIYTNPQAARTLLMYRYRLLEAAKENAAKNGYRGAQYPWESADTGKEETPDWCYGFDGSIIEVLTGNMEIHITSDVAFAVYEYYRATGDNDFMINYGIEMFIETARFWSSRCEYDKELDRYEINNVIGPDEFHEPVNNNCYTNYFAKWNIGKAIELIEEFKLKFSREIENLMAKTSLTCAELGKWTEVNGRIYIPYDKKTKLIEQFEGYFKKKDCIIDEYDENDMPVWPKGVEIPELNKTQLVKQADVVMLMTLLDREFDEETKRVNYKYYEKRTMHKSSLSPGVYSIMGLRVGDRSRAYRYFMRTANVDLLDNQGNTAQGLHAAAAGGAWQAAVFGFGGMHADKDGKLCFKPCMPDEWKGMSFKVYWKGRLISVRITKDYIEIIDEGEQCNV